MSDNTTAEPVRTPGSPPPQPQSIRTSNAPRQLSPGPLKLVLPPQSPIPASGQPTLPGQWTSVPSSPVPYSNAPYSPSLASPTTAVASAPTTGLFGPTNKAELDETKLTILEQPRSPRLTYLTQVPKQRAESTAALFPLRKVGKEEDFFSAPSLVARKDTPEQIRGDGSEGVRVGTRDTQGGSDSAQTSDPSTESGVANLVEDETAMIRRQVARWRALEEAEETFPTLANPADVLTNVSEPASLPRGTGPGVGGNMPTEVDAPEAPSSPMTHSNSKRVARRSRSDFGGILTNYASEVSITNPISLSGGSRSTATSQSVVHILGGEDVRVGVAPMVTQSGASGVEVGVQPSTGRQSANVRSSWEFPTVLSRQLSKRNVPVGMPTMAVQNEERKEEDRSVERAPEETAQTTLLGPSSTLSRESLERTSGGNSGVEWRYSRELQPNSDLELNQLAMALPQVAGIIPYLDLSLQSLDPDISVPLSVATMEASPRLDSNVLLESPTTPVRTRAPRTRGPVNVHEDNASVVLSAASQRNVIELPTLGSTPFHSPVRAIPPPSPTRSIRPTTTRGAQTSSPKLARPAVNRLIQTEASDLQPQVIPVEVATRIKRLEKAARSRAKGVKEIETRVTAWETGTVEDAVAAKARVGELELALEAAAKEIRETSKRFVEMARLKSESDGVVEAVRKRVRELERDLHAEQEDKERWKEMAGRERESGASLEHEITGMRSQMEILQTTLVATEEASQSAKDKLIIVERESIHSLEVIERERGEKEHALKELDRMLLKVAELEGRESIWENKLEQASDREHALMVKAQDHDAFIADLKAELVQRDAVLAVTSARLQEKEVLISEIIQQ
ncbi:hypothetical protein HDU93_002417, partial [Gonapodya sp. JEL0774]